MSSSTTKLSSPFSSPNSAALLKRSIIAWSLETGLPASIHVRAGGKIFNLHKLPLVSKSGYFNKALLGSSDVELPEDFPGGSETFEIAALFCYNSPLPFDPFNAASIRCAANLLEMTEDYSCNNLCARSDLYINQVVLQSWDDTLTVLRKCQSLLPWAEKLLIVSRCVESLVFMACMEILDPENNMVSQDIWIKDLVALPLEFFKRIIASLRRQGMKEKYVSPLIVFYASEWVLSKKTDDDNDVVSEILRGILELLPMGEESSRAIPTSFYFSLLSRSTTLNLSDESMMKLHGHVASLLHLAQVEDFLLPEKSVNSITSTPEFETMEKIVLINVSSKTEAGYNGCTSMSASSNVAELWDRYLSQIAMDPTLEPGRFMELIEIIPMADRETHDHLYRALNTFLLEHTHLSSEEKTSVCKYLNCQKLSQEICIEAVQNELMPVRLIVQALFIQQLHTHQVFKECSDSFRYVHYDEEFSGSFSSSKCQIPKSQNLEESPLEQEPDEKVICTRKSELNKEENESTSFRLQALEEELMSLKRSLRWQNIVSKGSDNIASKKRRSLRHVSSCTGLSWASQRKYASRLLKMFRSITMLRKGKSKKKKAGSGLPSALLACKSKPLHQVYNC